MAKYKVGVEFECSGIVYVNQEADTEDEAAAAVEARKEEVIAQAIIDGDGSLEGEVCDVITDKDE